MFSLSVVEGNQVTKIFAFCCGGKPNFISRRNTNIVHISVRLPSFDFFIFIHFSQTLSICLTYDLPLKPISGKKSLTFTPNRELFICRLPPVVFRASLWIILICK